MLNMKMLEAKSFNREKVPDREEAIVIIIEEDSRLKLVLEAPPNQLTAFIAKKN